MKTPALIPALVFLVFGTCVLGMAAMAKPGRAITSGSNVSTVSSSGKR